jgi:hypothetical protein
MKEHRFSYPIVVPLQQGATAHGPAALSLGLAAARVRSSAAEQLRPSTAAQLDFSTPRSPRSHPHLRVAFGGHS